MGVFMRLPMRSIILVIMLSVFFLSSCGEPMPPVVSPPADHNQTAPTTAEQKNAGKDSANKDAVSKPSDEETFTDISGKQYQTKDLRGKVVLVVYWATWCPPCRHEIPALNQLHEKYAARGTLILAVSQDDKLETLKNFLQNEPLGRSIKYPVVYGRSYLNYFGRMGALPTMILVDREGKGVGKQEGAVPEEAIADAIEKIL